MKKNLYNWIYGLAIIALFAGGCAAIHPNVAPQDFSRLNSYTSGLVNFQQRDELWVIERNSQAMRAFSPPSDSGGLRAVVHRREIPMPLTHMDVSASVNGYIGTVNVTQQFENPYAQKIEAVYVFSLPPNAAVDDFVMTIGKRRIRGIIRERKDAEAIYQEAKRQGYLASLLTANQANTFQQSIANIEPGNNIDVRIQYFQALHLVDGWYEFLFPTEANTKGSSQQQSRPGVSLHMDINAGAPIQELQSPTHLVVKKSISPEHWAVQLSPEDGIPYEDFKLRYRLTNSLPQSSLMAYRDERGGYFTLILQSPNESPLTDLKIDWGALQVSEIYPQNLTNLPPNHATLLSGSFSGTTPTTIAVTGTAGNQRVSFSIPVDFSKTTAEKAIPKIWASMKIAGLAEQSARTGDLDLLRETRQIALDYGLVSPFTSFLAVDASGRTGDTNTITVPAVP